jgi:hypothetical protein
MGALRKAKLKVLIGNQLPDSRAAVFLVFQHPRSFDHWPRETPLDLIFRSLLGIGMNSDF